MIDNKKTLVLEIAPEECFKQALDVIESTNDRVKQVRELEKIPNSHVLNQAQKIKYDLFEICENKSRIIISSEFTKYSVVIFKKDKNYTILLFDDCDIIKKAKKKYSNSEQAINDMLNRLFKLL